MFLLHEQCYTEVVNLHKLQNAFTVVSVVNLILWEIVRACSSHPIDLIYVSTILITRTSELQVLCFATLVMYADLPLMLL